METSAQSHPQPLRPPPNVAFMTLNQPSRVIALKSGHIWRPTWGNSYVRTHLQERGEDNEKGRNPLGSRGSPLKMFRLVVPPVRGSTFGCCCSGCPLPWMHWMHWLHRHQLVTADAQHQSGFRRGRSRRHLQNGTGRHLLLLLHLQLLLLLLRAAEVSIFGASAL